MPRRIFSIAGLLAHRVLQSAVDLFSGVEKWFDPLVTLYQTGPVVVASGSEITENIPDGAATPEGGRGSVEGEGGWRARSP